MHGFVVRRPGVGLSVEGRGAGSPWIFLHGFGGSMADWDRVWALLPDDRELWRYDQRGFGGSVATDEAEPFSHAEDLLGLLEGLRLERANLVGVSQGGGVALNFALDHPEKVGRLVLVSPMIQGWSWSEDWVSRWKAIGRLARTGEMAAAREAWWQHPLFAPARASDAAEDLHASIRAFAGRQWVKDAQRPVLPDVERLHLLRVPTRLLTGGLDLPDFRLMAEAITASAPDVAREDHPQLGHMLHLEAPDIIAAAL